MLEELRIQCQRFDGTGDGLLIFFFAKVGIGKVAVEDGHVTRIVIAFDTALTAPPYFFR